MTNEQQTNKAECPNCRSKEATSNRWLGVDRVFETTECVEWGQLWGRIIGPTWSGQFHYLGITESHAFKLSRHPRSGVKA